MSNLEPLFHPGQSRFNAAIKSSLLLYSLVHQSLSHSRDFQTRYALQIPVVDHVRHLCHIRLEKAERILVDAFVES